jgi:hypothetical protein
MSGGGTSVVELDLVVGRDDTRREGDRRDMAFSGGTETHDEAKRSGREAGLVGVGNDGWIKQGGGFDRELS